MLLRYNQAESEIRELLSEIETLKGHISERDNLISAEREKRLRAEQEVQRQAILMDRTQRELTVQSSRASALRAEGRKAKKDISEAAEYIREIAGVLQATVALSSAAELHTKFGRSAYGLELENIDRPSASTANSSALPSRPSDPKDSKESDSLGAREISSALETIRGMVEIIRKVPQSQMSLENSMRRLEAENSRYQRELEGIEIVHEDRIQRLNSEVKQLEDQIRTLRTRDTGRSDNVTRTLAHLEQENALLRERVDRADRKEKELLLEIATLTDQVVLGSLQLSDETGEARNNSSDKVRNLLLYLALASVSAMWLLLSIHHRMS
jgi:multidrug resistance efflux pump